MFLREEGTFTREEGHIRERMFVREEGTFAREEGHVRKGRRNVCEGRGDDGMFARGEGTTERSRGARDVCEGRGDVRENATSRATVWLQ